MFRFTDGKYYVVRANALEDNFRLYSYDRGRRQLATATVKAPGARSVAHGPRGGRRRPHSGVARRHALPGSPRRAIQVRARRAVDQGRFDHRVRRPHDRGVTVELHERRGPSGRMKITSDRIACSSFFGIALIVGTPVVGARRRSRLEGGGAGPRQVGPAAGRRRLPRRDAADRSRGHREGCPGQGGVRARVLRGLQAGGRPGDGHGRPRPARSGGAGGDVRPPERRARGHRGPQPSERDVAARDVHALRGPRRRRPAGEGAAPGAVRQRDASGRRRRRPGRAPAVRRSTRSRSSRRSAGRGGTSAAACSRSRCPARSRSPRWGSRCCPPWA